MKIDLKGIIVSILSVIVAILGGSHYQQASNLNDALSTIGTVQKDMQELSQVVKSIAHRDIARFESE